MFPVPSAGRTRDPHATNCRVYRRFRVGVLANLLANDTIFGAIRSALTRVLPVSEGGLELTQPARQGAARRGRYGR